MSVRIVTVEEIEDGLLARLGDPRITNAADREPIIQVNGADVPVFFEVPNPQLYDDETFPAIDVRFLSMRWDSDRAESEYEEEFSYDDGLDPPERTMIEQADPREIFYTVHMWSKEAKHDRELWQKVQRRLRARGALKIAWNVADEFLLYLFQSGDLMNFDMTVGDQRIYHKQLTYRVPFEMYDPDATSVEKVAVKLQWDIAARPELGVAPTDSFVYDGETETVENL